MYTVNEYITTILLGCLAFVKTQICDLDCGSGYRCALRQSTCYYPPCPTFPTCAMNKPQQNGFLSQRFGGRSKRSYTNRHRHRHTYRHSRIGSVLSIGLPAWAQTNAERPGQCPSTPITGPCINSCRIDSDCPGPQKCCENDCGRSCRSTVNSAVQKPGTCARWLSHATDSCRRECTTDADCLGFKKCCTTNCGARCTDPCYNWIQPRHRSNKRSLIGKLPFICSS